MLPHEINSVIAKMMFLAFATCMICFSKARAADVNILTDLVVSVEQNSLLSR